MDEAAAFKMARLNGTDINGEKYLPATMVIKCRVESRQEVGDNTHQFVALLRPSLPALSTHKSSLIYLYSTTGSQTVKFFHSNPLLTTIF